MNDTIYESHKSKDQIKIEIRKSFFFIVTKWLMVFFFLMQAITTIIDLVNRVEKANLIFFPFFWIMVLVRVLYVYGITKDKKVRNEAIGNFLFFLFLLIKSVFF
jgi:hypothetical protein